MDFAQLLEAAFVLSGATKTSADTKGLGRILSDRLDKVSTVLGADRYARSEAVQPERETALCALMILENVQHILDEDECEYPRPSHGAHKLTCRIQHGSLGRVILLSSGHCSRLCLSGI